MLSPGALPGWAALGVVAITLLGLEGAVRAGYHPPGELLPKVEKARASLDPEKPDLLVFGTCIAYQALDHDVFDNGFGAAARVHDLSAPGAFAMDWYLTLRNVLDPALVDMVIVLFTPGDLSVPSITWQAQTYALMDPTSIREVADWSCPDTTCRTELYLRKFSLLYRNRAYLGNHLWTAVGAREGTGPLLDQTPYTPNPNAASKAPWHFVGRMVELARERGTVIEFLELPLNPEAEPDKWTTHEEVRVQTEAKLAALGVTVRRLQTPPADEYEDLVHFTKTGRKHMAEQVLAVLADRPELHR